MLRQEYHYLLAAIQFFTRIPVPSAEAPGPDTQNQALKYFPLIGWLVGAFCALVFYLSASVWPDSVAVVLTLVAGILLTGALHEDGLADSCDGFGGGWNRDQVLRIMQDPRIGNFAAIGLILVLLLKAALMIELATHSHELLLIALLLAHPASRLWVLALPSLLDYARPADDSSKSRPLVGQRFSPGKLAYASLFVVLPLAYFDVPPLWLAFFAAGIVTLVLGLYYRQRLGGYSGDCLGATQQITELTVYLSLLASWSSL